MSKPYQSVKDAFNRGLDEITHDKRLREGLNKRLDEYGENGGDAESLAGTFYLEAAIQFEEPDAKYYAAKAAFDRALNGTRARKAKRDAPEHPGRHRASINGFVQDEYEPFKADVTERLRKLDGADQLLRQLAASAPANVATRAAVIELQRNITEIRQGYGRTDDVDGDDPAVKEVKGEKRKKLDERFKAVYKATADLVEATDREVARHARAIDELNVQSGEHRERLNQHDTMLREHDVVVTKVKSGIDNTGTTALVAAVIGAVAGFIAFVISLLIHRPDIVVRKETVRGVSIEQVIPSSHNGPGWALLIGLLVFFIVCFVAFIIGLIVASRHTETNTTAGTPTKKYDFSKRVDDKEAEAKRNQTQSDPEDTSEPDHVGTVNSMFHDDTAPTTAAV